MRHNPLPSFNGGSSNFARGGAGATVHRGSAAASNFVPRHFSGGGNNALSSGSITAHHSAGFNGTNAGSSNFVHRNFGNSSGIGGNNLHRHNGAIGNLGNSSVGSSNIVSRNFHHVGGINGTGNLGLGTGGRGNANFGTHHGGLNNNFTSANFSYNRHNSFNNFNNYSYSHRNHNHWNNNSYFFGNRSPFGSSYFYRPSYGYGGYGGYGYGGGYGNYYRGYGYYPYRYNYGYRCLPLLTLGWGYGLGLGGYGLGYGGLGGYGYGGYGNYGYGYSPVTTYYSVPVTGTTVQNVDPATIADDGTTNALDFAGQGEIDFKAGKYKEAVRDFRHALVDDPENGAYVMLLGQALFANGQYDEAAGATQQAAQMLPQDKWGTVVANYREIYTNIGDYTKQLRTLEKARDEKPDDPAMHFLLGWHYGYLGYPKQAVRELDKTLALAPKDEVAKKVRDAMAEKLPKSDLPADPPAEKPAPPDAKGAET